MSISPEISAYGDAAVRVQWEADGFDAQISDAVHALAACLRQTTDFIDIMPGYDSLVASFDLTRYSPAAARKLVQTHLVGQGGNEETEPARRVDIPVIYGGVDGPDLDPLAAQAGLRPDDVIALHSGQDYRVCLMGFIPGFAFLSAVDPKLQHPRHATPRSKVPAGSVGIANWQTGIYGLESPGGWQIIGRTDAVMFDATRDKPFLVEAGDHIRFVPQ